VGVLASDPLRVLLVDDSPLIQERLRSMFNALPNVHVVGGAEDVTSALALVESLRPDVVVVDAELARGDKGLAVVVHVHAHHPEVRLIALSNFAWPPMRDAYLSAGAEAYFDKSLDFEGARQWVGALAAGGAGLHRPA
jgi:DNA-binding NarL/FixJ family response regulator